MSNLVGLKGSFLRANPAGIKLGPKRKENLEIGQESLPQGPDIIFTLGNKPQITQQDCTVPSGVSPAERIGVNSIIFDNPGPNGQESRTPFY